MSVVNFFLKTLFVVVKKKTLASLFQIALEIF